MKKILVIDDEARLRQMVNMALSQRGCEIIEAEDGGRGIDLARQLLPDLVLCDVNMEHVDGHRTLATLRDDPATAAIPFILMTGFADQAGMRHGMELGADDYLPKPFTIEGLCAAVEARLKKAGRAREEAERRLADLRDSISLPCRTSCARRSTAFSPTARSSPPTRRPSNRRNWPRSAMSSTGRAGD